MKKLLRNLESFNVFHLGDVKRIVTPKDFFNVLKEGLSNSKEAFISTMYFGEDEQSEELIRLIEKRNCSGKRTVVVLDKARGMTDHLKKMISKHKLYDNFYFMSMNLPFLPGKIQEIISVFHSKIMLFDEKAVLTGANINGSYFSVRLDRYFYTENLELVNLVIGAIFVPIMQGSKDIGGFNIVSGDLGSVHTSSYTKSKEDDRTSSDLIGKTLNDILERKSNSINIIDMLEEENISVEPQIVIYDGKCEWAVLEALVNRGFKEIYISTAYLNFPYQYIKLLKNTNVKIIINDPASNIFTEYGNHGGIVTDVYKYSSLRTALNLPKADIYEYRRDGFTMHAKGIWAFNDTVAVSMIGSSNMNRRSSERDSELNFLLVSNNEEHFRLFRSEVEELLSRSKLRTLKDLRSRDYSLLIILIFIFLNRYF